MCINVCVKEIESNTPSSTEPKYTIYIYIAIFTSHSAERVPNGLVVLTLVARANAVCGTGASLSRNRWKELFFFFKKKEHFQTTDNAQKKKMQRNRETHIQQTCMPAYIHTHYIVDTLYTTTLCAESKIGVEEGDKETYLWKTILLDPYAWLPENKLLLYSFQKNSSSLSFHDVEIIC